MHPVLTTARFKLQCDWRVRSAASDKVTALDEASSTPSAMDKRGFSHFTLMGILCQTTLCIILFFGHELEEQINN